MAPEHLCRPPSQGRIGVNRYARQPARIDHAGNIEQQLLRALEREYRNDEVPARRDGLPDLPLEQCTALPDGVLLARLVAIGALANNMVEARGSGRRSEEHTSELQSLMRISYAVFCLKKKIQQHSCITPRRCVKCDNRLYSVIDN